MISELKTNSKNAIIQIVKQKIERIKTKLDYVLEYNKTSFINSEKPEVRIEVFEDYVYNEDVYDMAIVINPGFLFRNKSGIYLFDIVEFAPIMTTPEFITMAISKFFDKHGEELILKEKYKNGDNKLEYGIIKGNNSIPLPLPIGEIECTNEYMGALAKSFKNKNYTMFNVKLIESVEVKLDEIFYTDIPGMKPTGGSTGPNMGLKVAKEINDYIMTEKKKRNIKTGSSEWRLFISD